MWWFNEFLPVLSKYCTYMEKNLNFRTSYARFWLLVLLGLVIFIPCAKDWNPLKIWNQTIVWSNRHWNSKRALYHGMIEGSFIVSLFDQMIVCFHRLGNLWLCWECYRLNFERESDENPTRIRRESDENTNIPESSQRRTAENKTKIKKESTPLCKTWPAYFAIDTLYVHGALRIA